MEKIKFISILHKKNTWVFILVFFLSNVFANEQNSEIDCSQVDINYTEQPNMTPSERLAAMNQAFFESLNRFELCSLSNQFSANGGGGGANGSASGSDSGSSNSNANNSSAENDVQNSESTIESKASPSITGDIPDAKEYELDQTETEQEIANKHEEKNNPSALKNGAKPQEIEYVNNDDAIASQIKIAAETETDPTKKAKLWDEYHKYKKSR